MISIIINIKNGEKRLERCLKSLVKFDEVILLDNYSTDNSIKIASKFSNVRILQSEFNGMGKVRNKASSYAKNDWIFFVDCDEILDSQLVNTILDYRFESNHIYCIYRKNYYNNLLINGSSWGNDWVPRIFNKSETSFDEDFLVHDRIKNDFAKIKIYQGTMLHFPYENVSQLIDKLQRYSTLYAVQNMSKKNPKLYTIPLRAFFMFLKSYILKKGFMCGFEGLAISYFNAMGVFAKYIKLYESINVKNIGMIFDIKDINPENIKRINNQIYLPYFIFILDDNEIPKTNILELLDNNLLISYKLINKIDVDNILYKKDFNLDAVILMNDLAKLVNNKFLKIFRDEISLKSESENTTIFKI